MSKQDTLILKGIALLMMIMVHIGVTSSSLFIHIGDYSLWSIIAGGCHPVDFFLMLSGYGLRHVYENGDKHHYTRLLKLFVHYWAIMLLFVTIGYFKIGADVYPGNWMKMIENITSYHTSYNYECWFLFPFIILSASYPIIFKIIDKQGGVFILISCLIYFICGYIISHYQLIYKTAPYTIYNSIQVFFMLFSFVIGAWLKKDNICEKLVGWANKHKHHKLILLGIIIFILIVNIPIKTSAFGPFFALALFISIWLIIRGKTIRPLQLIGKHSMNIWMIHTYFLHYLFHDEIYQLQYSILIYLTTLCLSLLSSYIINFLTSKIDQKLIHT